MPRVRQKPRAKKSETLSPCRLRDRIKQIQRICAASDDSEFNKEANALSRESIDMALKLCNTADSTSTLTHHGEKIRDKLSELLVTKQHLPIVFSLLTWNVEHHGFTSNDKNGKKAWHPHVNRSNCGYKETEKGLEKRLLNVTRAIASSGYPGLIGLNEIGILAFHKISKMLNYENGPSYQIFTGISDITNQLSSPTSNFFTGQSVSGLQGYSSPSLYDGTGNSPDLQDVYGNVIAIDTGIWKIIDVEVIHFPSQTFRSNTAIVSQLKYNIIGGPSIVWIHTHLKYTARGGSEKMAQIHSIQQIVVRERSKGIENIVISGDLYLDDVDVPYSLTRNIGFTKTHTYKTQYYSNPDDADQILIPVTSGIKSVNIKLLPTAMKDKTGWQGGWKRCDHSDHLGVLGYLSISGTSDTTREREYTSPDPSHTVNATNYKRRIRQLYEYMKSYMPQ